MIKKIKALEGKVWKSKIDGAYLSDVLILGKNDLIDNYEEVEPPNYEMEDKTINE